MRAEGTFTVDNFAPAAVATALPAGVATMERRYAGDVAGRSTTIFTSALDGASGVGTYVALESFAGAGGIAVDADGTHRVWFDYTLPGDGA
jgi:hypothetical protein